MAASTGPKAYWVMVHVLTWNSPANKISFCHYDVGCAWYRNFHLVPVSYHSNHQMSTSISVFCDMVTIIARGRAKKGREGWREGGREEKRERDERDKRERVREKESE